MTPELLDWGFRGLLAALVAYYFRSQKDGAAAAELRANESRQGLRDELRTGLLELKDIIKEVKSDLHALDQTDRAQAKDILDQGIRLRLVETTVGRLGDRFDDFGKFLQGLGFRKRDGGGE